MSQFSNTIAAVMEWENHKHEVADELFRCLGEPPQALAACTRRINKEFREGYFDDYGGSKGAVQMWRAAAVFPLEVRRKYGVEVCAEAGDPTTLEHAAYYAQYSGKPLDKNLIKLIKQAQAKLSKYEPEDAVR